MRSRRDAGFSFIEVMVALVILSMSLIILMESQTRSMGVVARARRTDQAVLLADTRMAELTQSAADKGITSLNKEGNGDFDPERYPGFKWRYRIVPVPAPDFGGLLKAATGVEAEDAKEDQGNMALFAGPLQAVTKMWGEAIREIHLEVVWNEGSREKSYELVTHMIVPEVAAQLQGFIGALSAAAGGGR